MRAKLVFSSACEDVVFTGASTSASNCKKIKNRGKIKAAKHKELGRLGSPEQQAQRQRLTEDLTDDDLRAFFNAFKGWEAADIQLFFREEQKERAYFQLGNYVAYITRSPEGKERLELWEDGSNQCLVTGSTSFVLEFAYRYCKAAVTVVLANARENYVPPDADEADFLEDPDETLADWRAFRRSCPALDRWSKKAQFEFVDADHPYYRFLFDNDEATGENVSLRGLVPLCAETVAVPAAVFFHQNFDAPPCGEMAAIVAMIRPEEGVNVAKHLEDILSMENVRVSVPLSVPVVGDVGGFTKLRPHNLEITWHSGDDIPGSPERERQLEAVRIANIERNANYCTHGYTTKLKKVATKAWQLENAADWNPDFGLPIDPCLSYTSVDRQAKVIRSWMPKKCRAAFRKLCMQQKPPDSLYEGSTCLLPADVIKLRPCWTQDPHIGTSAESFRSLICSAKRHGYDLRWGPQNGWSIVDKVS